MAYHPHGKNPSGTGGDAAVATHNSETQVHGALAGDRVALLSELPSEYNDADARAAMALPVVALGNLWSVEHSGTATSATDTTLTETGAGWTIDEHDGVWVVITGNTGAGQSREIESNTGDTLTVEAWDTNPDATSTFEIRSGKSQAIDWDGEGQAVTASVDGTATTLTKGTGWPAANLSDVVLDLTVSVETAITWTIIDGGAANWPESFAVGLHTIILRSRGGTIRAYYGGMVEAL